MKYFYYLMIILIFYSCGKNDELKISSQLANSIKNCHSFNEIFSKCDDINLDSGDQNLVGEIFAMTIHPSGQIIIADNIGKQILAFTKDGKFIRQYGREGKGPGEYLHFSDLKIRKGGELLTLDDKLNQLNIYSENGNIFKAIKLNFGAKKIISTDSGFYIYNTNPFPKGEKIKMVTEYNWQGEVKANFFESPSSGIFNSIPITGGDISIDNNGNIFIIHASNYRIYKYSPDGELIKEFGMKPKFYSPLVTQGKPNIDLVGMLNSFTGAVRLFIIDSKIVMVLFSKTDPFKQWIEFYDVNGNYLTGNIEVPADFAGLKAVSGDTLFLQRKSENKVDDKGELPNPSLMSYKFQFNIKNE